MVSQALPKFRDVADLARNKPQGPSPATSHFPVQVRGRNRYDLSNWVLAPRRLQIEQLEHSPDSLLLAPVIPQIRIEFANAAKVLVMRKSLLPCSIFRIAGCEFSSQTTHFSPQAAIAATINSLHFPSLGLLL
jgi:hypothetical protein